MTVLDLTTYPNPVLSGKAQRVKRLGEAEWKLIDDMIETMYAVQGVGLAAPQVGVAKQIIVCSPEGKPGKEYVFLNPEIIEKEGEEKDYEGCLSLPGVTGHVKRARKVKFRALDTQMKPVEMTVDGLFARIIQHEVDHLNGKVLIDRVGFSERQSMIDVLRKDKDAK